MAYISEETKEPLPTVNKEQIFGSTTLFGIYLCVACICMDVVMLTMEHALVLFFHSMRTEVSAASGFTLGAISPALAVSFYNGRVFTC